MSEIERMTDYNALAADSQVSLVSKSTVLESSILQCKTLQSANELVHNDNSVCIYDYHEMFNMNRATSC